MQSLFWLHVHSCMLIGLDPATSPPPAHLGAYTRALWSAKIDDISLWPPAWSPIFAKKGIWETAPRVCMCIFLKRRMISLLRGWKK
jgi:hypothetical protein